MYNMLLLSAKRLKLRCKYTNISAIVQVFRKKTLRITDFFLFYSQMSIIITIFAH